MFIGYKVVLTNMSRCDFIALCVVLIILLASIYFHFCLTVGPY
jgi:hypothetical protein